MAGQVRAGPCLENFVHFSEWAKFRAKILRRNPAFSARNKRLLGQIVLGQNLN